MIFSLLLFGAVTLNVNTCMVIVTSKSPKLNVGSRPVLRILKRGVQSTVWPLGHGEGEGAKLLHYG